MCSTTSLCCCVPAAVRMTLIPREVTLPESGTMAGAVPATTVAYDPGELRDRVHDTTAENGG